MSAILNRLKNLKSSSRELRSSPVEIRNQVLLNAAEGLARREKEILAANEKDVAQLDRSKPTSAFRDRLLLNSDRIKQMATSLRKVADLPDPIGETVEEKQLPNGLQLKRVRSPLGVIFLIFESRPNVAVEAFSLAIKSGNVIILKGGRESFQTTQVLYSILTSACETAGLSSHSFWGIARDPDRKITRFLLEQKALIDVVVPRGGDRLIEFVTKTSKIPIIKNDRGLCHVYIHEDADLDMAAEIVLNAKTQRPGVCNAMETLLVHEKVAAAFLPKAFSKLQPHQVEWKCCPISYQILKSQRNPSPKIKKAVKKDWDQEYLDLILNCRIVSSFEQAIEHIEDHGSKHSESIVTASSSTAKRFQSEVDAAVAYWNASTRFTDGFEFGLGGELGISTQKLHVRGPVGLRELTSIRWIVDGAGQVRN